MTSKTSFCSGTLLRKNITRYWPLWALFTGALLLTLFLPLSSYRPSGDLYDLPGGFDTLAELREFYTLLGLLLLFPYAIICAACCFGYLHKTRSAYMLHAFPVTRGVLFRTNLLSGLLFALVPWLAVTLLLLAVLASRLGGRVILPLVQGDLIVTLEYLFFYGLAVLCMHTSGKTVNGVLRYLLLNFAVPLLEWLLRLVFEPLLYGVATSAGLLTGAFSPYLYVFGYALGLHTDENFLMTRWVYLGVIAAAGVAMMAAAWVLYRKRRIESCGEAVAYGFLRPVFKFFLAVVSALCIGIPASAITYGDVYFGARIFPTLAFLLVGGFIGYFGAEMMLRRSARVFKGRVWIGFGCFAAVVVLSLTAVRFDWFGIVRRVPPAAEIASVEFSTGIQPKGTMILTDAADIDELRGIHQELLATHGVGQSVWDNAPVNAKLNLTYHLKNGDTLHRAYDICGVGPSEAVCERFLALQARPDLNAAYFRAWDLETAHQITVWGYNGENQNVITLTPEEAARLSAALQQDANDGLLTAFRQKWVEVSYELTIRRVVNNELVVFTYEIPATATATGRVLAACYRRAR